MTEAKHEPLEAVTTEAPSASSTDEMIKVLRSLCESAGMIGNHVAAIHLEAWRAIDNLTRSSLPLNSPKAKSDVSQDDLSGLMTPMEVAQSLGVCRATLLAMRKAGRFPQPIYMSARRLRYRRSDVIEWLNQQQASSDLATNSNSTELAP